VLDEYYTAPVFNEAGFKIIYTGALSSYYAMEYLLFAAEKLKNSHPDIKIIIVGDGENKLDLEKIKEEKKLTNVTFLGHLPKKNMLSVIRQADLAYLGLRYTKANQFGISTNKLFEYMYAKKIVLASYSTDYDLIKEAHFGYTVSPECSEAIYDAIVKVYNLKSMERKELGENGYKYLLKHHTFEKIAADYIKFFKNILQ
jgi:glycosyltransferase involved in cell wall biosynthesis